MKRVALLGATGSIGKQALEIIGADPELELVAAASGSQDIEGLAPLTQVGGDLTELLEQAEPDVGAEQQDLPIAPRPRQRLDGITHD